MSSSPVDILLNLVCIALGVERDFSLPMNVDWKAVQDLSYEQGLAALASDGLQIIYDCAPDQLHSLDSIENKTIKYDWFGSALNYEIQFEKHKEAINKLALLLGEKGIRILLMKGIGLSRYYPVPSHRATGDIDVYLYGKGREADEWIMNSLGIQIKNNEDKHSVFKFQGISVENHASMVNIYEYPSAYNVECFLEEQALIASSVTIKKSTVYLPTVMMDAIFLPYHIAGHFVYGGLSLKQLVDWAVFVNRFGREIDWGVIKYLSTSSGYYDFIRVLNGITIDRFGVDACMFPDWERDIVLENKVWDEIVSFHPESTGDSVIQRLSRFLSSKWKYGLVYRESFYQTIFKRAWASFRGRYLPHSRSVWGKNGFLR